MQSILPTLRALVLGAMLLLFAACGDDPTDLVAGQPGEGSEQPEENDQAVNEDDPDESDIEDSGEYVLVESRLDLISTVGGTIDELAVDTDGRTLLVRYHNASEPCAGAHVAVIETDTAIEVTLVTGLDPNAAAMTCITGIFPYQIAVPLDAPVGDRELVAVEPAPQSSEPDDPFEGAEFPTDQYLGLTEDEAMALGDIEQRVVRIARIDDEFFMLTQDFSPTRVNLEIEEGIVVLATSG